MSRTRIKFCGITRVEDAVLAAELGADAIGMVLHSKSPRTIDRETARRILAALPPYVTPVGLMVDAPLDLILDIADDLGLRHLQLQGDEAPETVAALSGKMVIKAIPVNPETIVSKLKLWRGVRNLRGILFETAGAQHGGGSGIANDWETIRKHQEANDFHGLPPIIAAGGLTPDNVADVVRLLHPWAVDVSSGIESARGIKSREKMEAFLKAVRSV